MKCHTSLKKVYDSAFIMYAGKLALNEVLLITTKDNTAETH